MAKHLGNKLTQESMRLLGAAVKERENCVIMLLTVDGNGMGGSPRVCLLSPYQIVATTLLDLYFEVYARSNTEQNLNRSGKATLVVPESKGLLYVHGNASKVDENSERRQTPAPRPNKQPSNTLYYLSISRVESDVSEIAPIISRMTFDISAIRTEYRAGFEQMKRRINTP